MPVPSRIYPSGASSVGSAAPTTEPYSPLRHNIGSYRDCQNSGPSFPKQPECQHTGLVSLSKRPICSPYTDVPLSSSPSRLSFKQWIQLYHIYSLHSESFESYEMPLTDRHSRGSSHRSPPVTASARAY